MKIAALLVIIFVAGFFAGGGTVSRGEGDKFIEINREGAPTVVDWQLLWDTIAAIQEKYVNRPVDMQEILFGAARGAAGALDDPYTVFLKPQEAEEFQDELSGNFEGIGAEIATKNEQLTVVAPLSESPAERAGLRAGDFIFKVDGEETTDMTLAEAVSKIRGRAGTQVTLTIFRKGESETRDITITRARIVVKSVESEVREVAGKRIGLIKLRRFGEDTEGLLDDIISDLLVQNVDGVILDIRNNPGGFLETAVEVSSNWVRAGETVVIQQFGDGSRQVFEAKGNARLNGVKTIVLMNEGSASASEIVAGALRDHKLATLVGEKSFGKGSVQELIDLRGGADLKLTVAKWLTPSGHDLNEAGLEPDVKVELTDEDFNADRDPQLDRALELLAQ